MCAINLLIEVTTRKCKDGVILISFCLYGGEKCRVWASAAGARSKNSATNHSTFKKKSELFSIGGGHVVPVVNNTTCFSKYKWLLFLLLFSSYFPFLSHSFLK